MFRLAPLPLGLVLLLGGFAPADDKPAKGELQKFQGTWEGTSSFGDQPLKMVVTVKGDSWTFENTRPNGARITGNCKIAINEASSPKTLDFIDLVRRTNQRESQPSTQLAIYEFVDKDTLRVCNGFRERPTEFKEGTNEVRQRLFTLKRSR